MNYVFERKAVNPFTERRKQVIQQIIDFVDRNPGRYESRIKALFALNTGATPRTIQGYIDVALDSEVLERHDKRLYVKSKAIQDPRPLKPDQRGDSN